MANGLINLGKYNILPQTSKTIAIPGYAKIVADKKYRGKEKTLNLTYKLNSDSLLLSKDEEIAHQQFVISDYKFPVLNSSETAKSQGCRSCQVSRSFCQWCGCYHQ